MTHFSEKTNQLIANTIRGLSIDAIQKANSGHPGLPLGMADVATVLWTEFLKFNPKNPEWFNRDRFVLSGGHGSMLIYSLLHLFGYDLSMDQIKAFRQTGSMTPGHPEVDMTPGVETTTGPLGQGIANAVGMAIAEAHLNAKAGGGNIIDHFTYVMAGDGDLQEGISHEACSLAAHLQLGKLILLYDSNDITIDGSTSLSYSDDVKKRFESYGWQVLSADGHNHDEIRRSLNEATQNTDKPSLIICKTLIGYGSPNKAGTSGVHGSPLGEEEVGLTKEKLGIPNEPFYMPSQLEEVKSEFIERGRKLEESWNDKLEEMRSGNPKEYDLVQKILKQDYSPVNIGKFEAGGKMATRKASGTILSQLTSSPNNLIGGSADLTPSNNTQTGNHTAFSKGDYAGNYLHYGVREHGMGSIMNGIALHGGLVPYGGTFFVFSDYMRPSIRLAGLMELQVIFVLTHDSIGLGEDGPTHQPVEHLSSLRAMPNVLVLRPMDANETAEAWKIALSHKSGPTCIVLTRQGLPVMDADKYPVHNAQKGGYVLCEDKGFDRIIIASGSEVKLALEAREELNKVGIKTRIVSMFSTELFDQQDEQYRNEVLPANITNRLAIEAGSSHGWHKYVGMEGKIIGLDRFGASGPQDELFAKFGITSQRIIELMS